MFCSCIIIVMLLSSALTVAGENTEENLIPVELAKINTVKVETAKVPLVEIKIPEIFVKKIYLKRLIVDCGIVTPQSYDTQFSIVPTPKTDSVPFSVMPTPKTTDVFPTVISTPKNDNILSMMMPTPKTVEPLFSVIPTPNVTDALSIVMSTPKNEEKQQFIKSFKFYKMTPTINTVKFPEIFQNMNEMKNFREKLSIFSDKQSVLYDSQAILGSKIYESWYEIYKNNESYIPEYVPIRSTIRMIAEVRLPIDPQILDDNLGFYFRNGYNSILLTFDGSEHVGDLITLATRCKNVGFSVWFAFGGKEDLKQPVFISPNVLKRFLEKLATMCDGFLLHWRRTSLHLFVPDEQYQNFVIKTLRNVNPKICILGESYFKGIGNGEAIIDINIPTNSSGCLITNVGHQMISPKIMTTVFGSINIPKIILINGSSPYYMTVRINNNSFNFDENFKIKKYLEQRFLNNGASGTITLHGDGSDGMYSATITDNIAQMKRK